MTAWYSLNSRRTSLLGRFAQAFDIPVGVSAFLLALIAFRLMVFALALPLPFDGGHTWRQSDTLGVALRYWLRFSHEPFSFDLLLPAVLNLGDFYGIMPTEFPLLNLLIAPAFYFGPTIGLACAKATFMLLSIGCLLGAAREWRGSKLLGMGGERIALLMAFCGIASAYWLRVMPDFISMILAFWGVGCLWSRTKRPIARGLAILTLALLIKPTSIIVFALLLLASGTWREKSQTIAWLIIPAAIAATYYTVGTAFITTYSDAKGLYKVGMSDIFTNLASFYHHIDQLPELLTAKLLFAPGLPLLAVLLTCLPKEVALAQRPAWAVLILQILAIAAIDGDHAFVHDYYYIGCSPLLAWLTAHTYLACRQQFPQRTALISVLAALLVALPFLDRSYFNIRAYFSPFASHKPHSYDCQKLIEDLPHLPWRQNYAFRSAPASFPTAGLCFAEREGSAKARYGLYYGQQQAPSSCIVIAKRGSTRVVDCFSAAMK